MRAVAVDDDHGVGRRLEQPRNLSSAFLRSVMSRMALETSVPVLGLERAQADLDGELGAVLAQAVELEARAHRRATLGSAK